MSWYHHFFSKTSLHGWSHLGDGGSMFKKMFWFLVLISSYLFCGCLIKEMTEMFLSSSTVLKVKDRTHTLNDTYFPSLVIANINPLRCQLNWRKMVKRSLYEKFQCSSLISSVAVRLLRVHLNWWNLWSLAFCWNRGGWGWKFEKKPL